MKQVRVILSKEAEEVFANKPFYRKTKKSHYAVFGPTLDGRYLTIIFELKPTKASPVQLRIGI